MGFDSAKFITSVADDKKCVLCRGVLDNPVRSPCGHVFCSSCILPWVVSYGQCPKKCRTLTPTDLENVLPLREVILNLKVKCEFAETGCTEVIRLTDLIRHAKQCNYRPTTCSNTGCAVIQPLKEIYLHETETCSFRPVGACDKGCGLPLHLHNLQSHDCNQALKSLVKTQEHRLRDMEQKVTLQNTKFTKREKALLNQIVTLTREMSSQKDQFNKTIKDIKKQNLAVLEACVENTNDFVWKRIVLHRDNSGSLGFNIMGGHNVSETNNNNTVSNNNNNSNNNNSNNNNNNNNTSSTTTNNNNNNTTNNNNDNNNNNNNNSQVGVVISRVTEGGVGDINGIKVYDRIIKVNGQDLSQSSHTEAVDAFRSAKEPIVVEVLRRNSSKTNSHSNSSSGNHHHPHSNHSSSSSNHYSSIGCNSGRGGGGGSGSSGCGSGSSGSMKTRCPIMVSIGTQTEEDFYCYNRPPTPPPGFYPIPLNTGLYQPASRRPVAFSPSADMGLTDIEMVQPNFDIDDPYFDDRNYEMVYEEVVLSRTSTDQKLGLTLCYGSLEDEVTDIFISEVDPNSIAGMNGCIREGDQIVQIDGIDVRSRSEAISLFSAQTTVITLTVARPQLQCDDGFLEEPNLILDDLHMDLLEKHHQDNMQYMTNMLAARGTIDEEGGITDATATTENSSQKHEKDSGVGRTDESTRNDESSEQETFDTESLIMPAPNSHGKFRHPSTDSYLSGESPSVACTRFREMLDHRCGSNGNSPRHDVAGRKDSESSLERELAMLNKEMEDIQVECQDLIDNHNMKDQQQRVPGLNESVLRGDTQRSPRIVPRMGTRLPMDPSGLSRKPVQSPLGGPSSPGLPTSNNGSTGSPFLPNQPPPNNLSTTKASLSSSSSSSPSASTTTAAMNINNNIKSNNNINNNNNNNTNNSNENPYDNTYDNTYSNYAVPMPPTHHHYDVPHAHASSHHHHHPHHPSHISTSGQTSSSSGMTSHCHGGRVTVGVNSEFSSNTNTSSSNASTRGVNLCEKDKEFWTTTSAYNTGESCRSTPLTLELNPAANDSSEHLGLSGSMLCLATPSNGTATLVASDTEKQTQTPTKPRDYSSEDSGHGPHPKSSSSSHTLKAMSMGDSMKSSISQQGQVGESLQELYLRCADVMYTNRANLEHTISVQQKLFQQQLDQQAKVRGTSQSPGHANNGSSGEVVVAPGEGGAKNSPGQTAPSDSGQMEWVVKRRPDGTRYITRRPVRSKMLKERAKKITEERCGMTTDDDAMSEMKTGRYWSKEDRKRHLEKAKDYKRKKELFEKTKMDTLKEIEEKKEVNIVELSHRKMMKHKGKKVFDNFTTVKEMLAHGSKVSEGKNYNPLLSVTTV